MKLFSAIHKRTHLSQEQDLKLLAEINYEYMPDESWKGTGTCTNTYKGGDKTSLTWEEDSHLKEYSYKLTGGSGKYQGATGGGTYFYENLTDTLSGGTYKETMQLP